jgi:hypothetical protein
MKNADGFAAIKTCDLPDLIFYFPLYGANTVFEQLWVADKSLFRNCLPGFQVGIYTVIIGEIGNCSAPAGVIQQLVPGKHQFPVIDIELRLAGYPAVFGPLGIAVNSFIIQFYFKFYFAPGDKILCE